MEISAVIITYNDEKRLERALKSLQDVVSEIIVVDSHSTDNTLETARKYTGRVFERKWTNFADQKNWANQKASFPWILSLDSDECLSPQLKTEIIRMKNREPEAAGFSMPRRVFYLGKWIRHSGWYPDRKIRLFRKDRARWEGRYVHENLKLDGKARKLQGDIHHFTYRDISEHMERINRFSGLGAQKLYAAGKKACWAHLLILPPVRFMRTYLLRAGMLDGFPGLVIAVLNGYAVFARYAKLKEIWKKGERIEPFPN